MSSSYLSSGNPQLTGFSLTVVGWILLGVSVGQVEWRLWHLGNTTSIIPSGSVWVGILKVCYYSSVRHSPRRRTSKVCHTYGMRNSFLPEDFRAIQHILLLACILGAMGKASLVIGLRNLHLGIARKSTACNSFTIGGLCYLSAGICVLISVLWNFNAVFKNEGISFPASFHIPPRPKAQEVGTAISTAIISVILMLLGGAFFFFYKFPVECPVHPLITGQEMDISS
ncbi:claudin-34 [Gracilinanus agilis]|uniref:claudin-34 n=1 Tax=Gracilinanus agilis TaxID=191870 RepID=UPI001CFD34DD|nr:claudin-34 [Gracilinanus agilis]